MMSLSDFRRKYHSVIPTDTASRKGHLNGTNSCTVVHDGREHAKVLHRNAPIQQKRNALQLRMLKLQVNS